MSAQPNKNLVNHYQQTESELADNLYMLNELFKLFGDKSLSDEELIHKALPLIEKLGHNNPHAAKEIREVLESNDQSKIKAYFEKEKSDLFDYINNEASQADRAKQNMCKEKSQRPDFKIKD